MWKKFLAVMAIVGIFSTTASALAGGAGVPGSGNADTYISGLNVTPMTFAPSKGEAATVGFTLLKNADIYAYAVDPQFNVFEIQGTVVAPVATVPGPITYTWNGKKADGTVLADGKYLVKVVAFSTGSVVDSKTVTDVTISSVPAVNPAAPVVSNLTVKPLEFSTNENLGTDISFNVSTDGFVTVQVKNGATVVRSFAEYDGNDWYKSTAVHSINWNGKNNSGETVAVGTYSVVVSATNDDGLSTASTDAKVTDIGPVSSGVIENFKLDPSNTWDPTDEVLELKFELTKEAKFLQVQAKQGNKVVEIIDDSYASDDKYTETWDGTDDNGNYVKEGAWEITVRADGDKVTKTVNVKYEDVSINNAFVTKSTFDPSEYEVTNLVFKANSKSSVTVEAYKGAKREMTLVKDEVVEKNKWYAVQWDGRDKDGYKVDYGKDWKFKITAENTVEDKVSDSKTVEFDIEQDEVSDNKSNITSDYFSPVVFDYNYYSSAFLSYDIDLAADVYVAIYKGTSTSGKAEIELLDYSAQTAGSHNIEWNVTDKDGKSLKDGNYSYKIITRTSGNHKDTEVGSFVVGEAGDYITPVDPEPPNPEPPKDENCGGYWDTYSLNDYELCEAINWVTTAGIFNGYADGSFGSNNYINRAEVLKVALTAFPSSVILPGDGYNQGFWDLDGQAWYMPYVRTAKFYGMMQGYPDGSAGLNKNINRVEFLKFVLEASESFAGFTVPDYYYSYYTDVDVNSPSQAWFKNYAGVAYDYMLYDYKYDYVTGAAYLNPGALVTRGEVAKLLYRMHQYGLLDGYYGYNDYY